MFSVLKVREGIASDDYLEPDDYSEPGGYVNPPGTEA